MADHFERAIADAENQRGTAEYLNKLLTGKDHTCPHPHKEKNRDVPQHVGYFSKTDGRSFRLDTDKVCQKCFNEATPEPDGIAKWSIAYKSIAGNEPFDSDYYPLMQEAGTARDHNPEVSRITMPRNAEAHEAYRKMQEDGRPFYVDQQHLTPPWDPSAEDQHEEDRRVARANNMAYEYPGPGYIGTGVGGAGVNTIVEQRILGDRAEQIPGSFGHNLNRASEYIEEDDVEGDEDLIKYAGNKSAIENARTKEVLEFPNNWPENYNMPENDAIDEEESSMRGFVSGPTEAEQERREKLKPEPYSKHHSLLFPVEEGNEEVGSSSEIESDEAGNNLSLGLVQEEIKDDRDQNDGEDNYCNSDRTQSPENSMADEDKNRRKATTEYSYNEAEDDPCLVTAEDDLGLEDEAGKEAEDWNEDQSGSGDVEDKDDDDYSEEFANSVQDYKDDCIAEAESGDVDQGDFEDDNVYSNEMGNDKESQLDSDENDYKDSEEILDNSTPEEEDGEVSSEEDAEASEEEDAEISEEEDVEVSSEEDAEASEEEDAEISEEEDVEVSSEEDAEASEEEDSEVSSEEDAELSEEDDAGEDALIENMV